MRIAGFRPTSLFDGVGVNAVVFTQGCPHHCENCQNPSTWNPDGGKEVSVEDVEKMIEPYLDFITGVTFSGGDPAMQFNAVDEIAAWAKNHGLTTTMYTGYIIDELLDSYDLSNFDYIIDDVYVDGQHTTELPFRGSLNQGMFKRMDDGLWEAID